MKYGSIAVILLFALAASLFSGCSDKSGDGADTGTDGTGTSEDGTVVISTYADYDLNEYVTLGQYMGLTVTAFDPTVSDEALNEYINGVLEDSATTETVTESDHIAEVGDVVVIDYNGSMDAMDTPSGMTATDSQITLGSGQLIPGFEEGVVGMAIGETKDIQLTFPDPYSNNTDLSGQPATFSVTLKGYVVTTVPELTDEFVGSISDYSTVDEYKSAAMLELYSENQESGVNQQLEEVWSAALDNASLISCPEDIYNNYYDSFVSYYESYADYYGYDSLEAMMTSAYSMTLDEFYAQASSYAEDACFEEMVMTLIAQKENVTVSEAEYTEGASNLAVQYNFDTVDEFTEYYGKDVIAQTLLWDKLVDYLLDNATAVDADETVVE